MAFYPLERLHRLHDGYQQAFRVAGKDLLLIQDLGEVVLIHNRCPHMDAPLTYATIRDGKIRCSLHGIEFDLRSGQPLRGLCNPLDKINASYAGDQVGVYLEDSS